MVGPVLLDVMLRDDKLRIGSWVGLLAGLATGCREEADVDPCAYAVCSIDDPACIEQVATAVACKLGVDEVIVPRVRMLSAAEVVAEIEADLEQPSAQGVLDITDYFRGEALFGLMPADYVYSPPQATIADWAVAYYSVLDDEIVVITDNVGSSDPEYAYLVLVHEMVHVYQDHGRDLEALINNHAATFDRFMGVRAAIEGEASYYGALAEVELAGLTSGEVAWARYYADFQTNVLELAAMTEQPSLDAVGLFPYSFGSEFIFLADRDEGRASIDAVFANPPDSVRQVMGGYATWPAALQNGDSVLDQVAAPVLPDHYQFLGGGHQSAWLLNTMLDRTAGGVGLWAPQLTDVSADYLSVYRDTQSTSEIIAVWRIQTGAPAQLSSALVEAASIWTHDEGDFPSSHVVTQVGDDIVLVATTGADAKLVLTQIEGWQSLEALGAGAGKPADVRTRRSVRPDILPTRFP